MSPFLSIKTTASISIQIPVNSNVIPIVQLLAPQINPYYPSKRFVVISPELDLIGIQNLLKTNSDDLSVTLTEANLELDDNQDFFGVVTDEIEIHSVQNIPKKVPLHLRNVLTNVDKVDKDKNLCWINYVSPSGGVRDPAELYTCGKFSSKELLDVLFECQTLTFFRKLIFY